MNGYTTGVQLPIPRQSRKDQCRAMGGKTCLIARGAGARRRKIALKLMRPAPANKHAAVVKALFRSNR